MLELAHDQLQRSRAEFLDVAGQHQSHRGFLGESFQLLLKPRQIGFSQPMQRGNGARLEEVRHTMFLSLSWVVRNAPEFSLESDAASIE